ncbi:hypothetical protein HN873_060174, partial [Arachis hypogaea]
TEVPRDSIEAVQELQEPLVLVRISTRSVWKCRRRRPSVLAPLGEPAPIESNMSSFYGKNKNTNPFFEVNARVSLNLKCKKLQVESCLKSKLNPTHLEVVDTSGGCGEGGEQIWQIQRLFLCSSPSFCYLVIGRVHLKGGDW